MVTISFSEEDKKKERGHVIEMFKNYLDIPGFRKGHIPTALVEQKVSPEQIDAEIIEHIVDHDISKVLKENQEIKFIGSPYGFKDEKD
ncbi:trigger factor family protein [bacterium]|nr:trigger factor family protein [bacterium]